VWLGASGHLLMDCMEHLGSHYTVVLHEPGLRSGLIADAERKVGTRRTKADLRFRLAHALRSLAARLESHHRLKAAQAALSPKAL
jgi:hypothetical protein